MIFEIINPGDDYTIEAEDWAVACAAGLIIGSGQLALKEIDGDHRLPFFLFGGLEEWTEAEFGKSPQDLVGSVDILEVAACLNSIVIGNRTEYMQGLGDKTGEEADAFWNEWHDRNQSSMNDIGSYARNYAANLVSQYGNND